MRRVLGFLTAGAFAVLLAACSAGGSGSSDQSTSAQSSGASQATEQPSEQPSEQSSGAVAVRVASSSAGQILTDAQGRTLYMFDPDKQGASTCYEQCAASWPPLMVTGKPAGGDGVDASLLGVTTRKDGTQQVTYNKWPLYYFAPDKQPGDINGQGVKDVWWVVDPAGDPIRK